MTTYRIQPQTLGAALPLGTSSGDAPSNVVTLPPVTLHGVAESKTPVAVLAVGALGLLLILRGVQK